LLGKKVPTSVKIDFIVPGFSKCGTTTLCALLDRHPDIYIPAIKEPWYFSHKNFETQHTCYDDHYSAASEGQLKGDGSTDYTGHLREEVSADRIFENNPDCRFIFIARNPKTRIESSYREMHHSGVTFGLNVPYGLSDCFAAYPQMIKDTMFWDRISVYRRVFGDDAILVVFLEDLKSNSTEILSRCLAHIGLEPGKLTEMETVSLNTGEKKLYDTRPYRFLRTNRYAGKWLAKLQGAEQDRIFSPLGLRRAFGKSALQWDIPSNTIFEKEIVPDSLQFLSFYNKRANFWGLDEFV
jgi:hypothetical protein